MSSNAIEIKNLCKKYPNFSLDNINLILPTGCITGIMGKNGAGKSTIIKLILNMIHKDSGSIKILGKDNIENIKELKEDIGIVLDEVGLPEALNSKQIGNIMKNTFKNWDDVLYNQYLDKFSISDKKQFKDFSKGMKMKLGIIIALSHNSKLLILDEATSGLDPIARDELIQMLYDFTRDENHSILISSHIISDLEKICDYIAFIHDGKLILHEEKDILISKYGILHCNKEEFEKIDPNYILDKRITAYGIEALVYKNSIPTDIQISPINLEELFISMIKERN